MTHTSITPVVVHFQFQCAKSSDFFITSYQLLFVSALKLLTELKLHMKHRYNLTIPKEIWDYKYATNE